MSSIPFIQSETNSYGPQAMAVDCSIDAPQAPSFEFPCHQDFLQFAQTVRILNPNEIATVKELSTFHTQILDDSSTLPSTEAVQNVAASHFERFYPVKTEVRYKKRKATIAGSPKNGRIAISQSGKVHSVAISALKPIFPKNSIVFLQDKHTPKNYSLVQFDKFTKDGEMEGTFIEFAQAKESFTKRGPNALLRIVPLKSLDKLEGLPQERVSCTLDDGRIAHGFAFQLNLLS